MLAHDIARSYALEAGFTEAGLIALPHMHESRDAERFNHWIHEGRSGSMQYLSRTGNRDELVRARVGNPFPWARSAIVCLASYNADQPLSVNGSSTVNGSGSVNAAPPSTAWIARYAWSSRVDENGTRRASDYHKVLLHRLKQLDARLRGVHGEFESRAYVDTGPIVERSLAVAAGLGWIGKNTCLISQRHGSFAFLAVLLTSLPVETGRAAFHAADRCGSCTRCIEACPTDALIAPYQMDATRCISYLTIEHRGPLDEELMNGMGRQVFGCDICQDVCPWNRKAPIARDPEMEARAELVNPTLDWLAAMDESAFERTFNGSPVRRASFLGLRRNIAVAIGNSGQSRFAGQLEAWARQAGDSAAAQGVRAAARWALHKLTGAEAKN